MPRCKSPKKFFEGMVSRCSDVIIIKIIIQVISIERRCVCMDELCSVGEMGSNQK